MTPADDIRHIEIHGRRVAYRTSGSGPVILLVHGASQLEDAILVIQPGKGVFAPEETRVWQPFKGFDGVESPNIHRIRIGREASS